MSNPDHIFPVRTAHYYGGDLDVGVWSRYMDDAEIHVRYRAWGSYALHTLALIDTDEARVLAQQLLHAADLADALDKGEAPDAASGADAASQTA